MYDTGSTDNTIAVTEQFFEKNNISNYVIKQGECIDFAASRNQALDLAERYFPDAKFMLMLDAEWILCGGKELLQFCHDHKNEFKALYNIRIMNSEVDFYHARLIRCRSGIYFTGRVHEVPNIAAQGQLNQNIYFQLNVTSQGKQKTEQRWYKDLENLLQDYVDNPNNPRTLYYIGQTYFALSDWNNAIKWYQQRLQMQGDAEEKFMACLCLGHAYACAHDAQKMVLAYLRAYHMRPWRADPLIRLAEYYFKENQYALALLFAKASLKIPYPDQEKMVIEKIMYDTVRYEILSVAAMQCGEFSLGRQATQYLLAINPESKFLQQLLQYYESVMNNGMS